MDPNRLSDRQGDIPASSDERVNHWMGLAIEEARLAAAEEEVPVGAVLVRDGSLLACDHNRREQLHDATAHAEILVIRKATTALSTWRLENCELFVTLEPCPMCAGAIVQARIPFVYFGALDPKGGACGSLFRICEDERMNHRSVVRGQIRESECGSLLSAFFSMQRKRGKK